MLCTIMHVYTVKALMFESLLFGKFGKYRQIHINAIFNTYIFFVYDIFFMKEVISISSNLQTLSFDHKNQGMAKQRYQMEVKCFQSQNS